MLILLFSCGINKRDRAKQRHGYWNETKPVSDGMLTSKGRYKHGEQKGSGFILLEILCIRGIRSKEYYYDNLLLS